MWEKKGEKWKKGEAGIWRLNIYWWVILGGGGVELGWVM